MRGEDRVSSEYEGPVIGVAQRQEWEYAYRCTAECRHPHVCSEETARAKARILPKGVVVRRRVTRWQEVQG